MTLDDNLLLAWSNNFIFDNQLVYNVTVRHSMRTKKTPKFLTSVTLGKPAKKIAKKRYTARPHRPCCPTCKRVTRQPRKKVVIPARVIPIQSESNVRDSFIFQREPVEWPGLLPFPTPVPSGMVADDFVYFISEDVRESAREGYRFCKIGKSYTPTIRVPSLETGNGRDLHIWAELPCVYGYALESIFHQLFDYNKRRVKREWYWICHDDLVRIKKYLPTLVIHVTPDTL